ncbi:MAG: GTP-binding protein, partial [Nitrospirota bacterium]
TEIPGTTRDTVEELVNLGGMPVRVIDTAGIRHSNDLVEREGIRRSEEALKAADLALVVLDGSRPLSAEDRGIIEKAKDIKHLIIINKYDLPQKLERGAVLSTPVYLSAKTGAGLDELTRRIKEAIFSGRGDRRRDYPLQSGGTAGRRGSDAGVGEMRVGAPEAMINLRHKTALERARSALVRFEDGCKAGLSQEFLAVELKDALNAVGEIVGQTAPDDVLNLIFSRFCIGK